MSGKRNGRHFLVGNLDLGGVGRAVYGCGDLQSLFRCGGSDAVDDYLDASQRPATPVHRHMREESVLNLIPLARPRREMAYGHGQPSVLGKLGQFGLPEPNSIAVASATVRIDEQFLGVGIGFPPSSLPPSPNARHRECGGVVVRTYVYPTFC